MTLTKHGTMTEAGRAVIAHLNERAAQGTEAESIQERSYRRLVLNGHDTEIMFLDSCTQYATALFERISVTEAAPMESEVALELAALRDALADMKADKDADNEAEDAEDVDEVEDGAD